MGSLAASLADELPGVTLAGYHGEASPSFQTISLGLSVYRDCLIVLLMSLPGASMLAQELEEAIQPYPPQVVAEVERLVDDLSSESYDAREAAGRRLVNIGEAAWDKVYEASQSAKDLELRYRAAELLKTLEKRKFSPIRIWEEHRDIVWAVAFSPDGRYLASGGAGRSSGATGPRVRTSPSASGT